MLKKPSARCSSFKSTGCVFPFSQHKQTQTQTTRRHILNAYHIVFRSGKWKKTLRCNYWNPYMLTQLTQAFSHCVCVCMHSRTHTFGTVLQKHSQFSSPQHSKCLLPCCRESGGSRDMASSCTDFTPINQGRNWERDVMVTSSKQTHAAHQLWALCPYPFFSLFQNGFLLITIIPKVLKHINRWVNPAYKGPAGWLLWPCPTAADTSFSDKSNLAVTRGLASLKKYWGWSGTLKSANAPLPYCFLRDFSAVPFGCL